MVLSKAEKEQKERDKQPGVTDPAPAHAPGAVPNAEEEAGQGGAGVCVEGPS